jgi:hypothetical protein
MRPSGPAAEYLAKLAQALSFDRALARRVIREIEDHLCEAVAESDPLSIEAQERAVQRLGDAREIARRYATLRLARLTRRSGVIIVLSAAALYIAMKVRIAWYGYWGWTLSESLRPVGRIVLAIDIPAYLAAFLLGALAFAYISTRSEAVSFDACQRRQLTRALLLASVAACPMLISVMADMAVTALRLLGEHPPAFTMAIPLISVSVEMAFVAVLANTLCEAIGTARRASSLLL